MWSHSLSRDCILRHLDSGTRLKQDSAGQGWSAGLKIQLEITAEHRQVRPMKTNLETIQDLVVYMEGHLEERLDLDGLCCVAGYSRYHLSRMFSAVAGFSVHTYIRRRRLTEAARLLVFTDKPVMDVAC